MTHAAHALVVIFFLDDARELLLDVDGEEVDEHINADLLVHDRETSLVFVAGLNQRWEEDLLQLLVMEVSNGEGA